MIYTSYFKNYDLIKNQGIKCYSIANRQPNDYKRNGIYSNRLEVIKELVPSWDMVLKYKNIEKQNNKILLTKIQTEFMVKYIEQLDNLTKNYNNLNELYKKLNGSCLFCWESPSKFCHRHIFREYFNSNHIILGLNKLEVIEEYGYSFNNELKSYSNSLWSMKI